MILACINFRKEFLEWDLGKRVKRKDLDKGGEVGSDSELLASDCDREVGADRGPELDANCVGRGAVKGADPQTLFDPAEEQLDLPTLAIELRDRGCGKHPLVGPECQAPRFLRIEDTDTPHQVRPVARNVSAVETNRLIGTKVRCAIDRARDGHVIPDIRSLPNDEKRSRIGDTAQAP